MRDSEVEAALWVVLRALAERKLATVMPGPARADDRRRYLAGARNLEHVPSWVLAGVARFVEPALLDQRRTGFVLSERAKRIMRGMGAHPFWVEDRVTDVLCWDLTPAAALRGALDQLPGRGQG